MLKKADGEFDLSYTEISKWTVNVTLFNNSKKWIRSFTDSNDIFIPPVDWNELNAILEEASDNNDFEVEEWSSTLASQSIILGVLAISMAF